MGKLTKERRAELRKSWRLVKTHAIKGTEEQLVRIPWGEYHALLDMADRYCQMELDIRRSISALKLNYYGTSADQFKLAAELSRRYFPEGYDDG